jgi:hypothetical protein
MGAVGTIFETTKGKSMKFVWRYIRRKLQDLQTDHDEPDEIRSNRIGTVRARDDFEGDNGLNMQLHKAIGGRIVSFNHYDRKTDRSNRTVYIITDEQDFERELSKIITMESMRG